MATHSDRDAPRTDTMATPFEGRHGPGVLVIHSGRGLTNGVEELCHHLAHQGYVAYAPDLFDGRRPSTVEEANTVKESLSTQSVISQLEDAVVFLRDYRRVSRRQIAVLGLGFGGELALRLIEESPDNIAALIVFYGLADIDWQRLPVPIQGHFAELDPEIPERKLREIQAQVEAGGGDADFKLYAGVEPSFFEDDPTARYDPETARKAWNITLEFLSQTF